MVQLTYWETPEREAAAQATKDWRNVVPHGPTELRHGYTLDDLHRLANIAVHADPWHRAMDVVDRLEIAWSAIAEQLYACEERPAEHDLIRDARTAISGDWVKERSAHGVSAGDPYAGRAAAPNYQRFWFATPAPSPENRVVDRIAVQQILPTLRRFEREALLALATFDDYASAERALGIAEKTLPQRVKSAREAFRELWHEGETPSGQWRRDRRVGSRTSARNHGAKLTDDQVRAIRSDPRSCKKVGDEHGVSAETVSRIRRHKIYRDVA
jgi:hypothetical protein